MNKLIKKKSRLIFILCFLSGRFSLPILAQNNQGNFYLKGAFAPTHKELSKKKCKVLKGEVPKEISGSYYRNGPNPFYTPKNYIFPLNGDGMIHKLSFQNGKVIYSNKFIQTDKLKIEKEIGKSVFGDPFDPRPVDLEKYNISQEKLEQLGLKQPIDNSTPMVHVFKHGGKLITFWEAATAYEIDENLNTIGKWKPINASKPPKVNAHSRLDPETGDRWFFSYATRPFYLHIFKIDKNGKHTKDIWVKKDTFSMMHDFVITKNHIVVYDAPALITRKGLQWVPQQGTKIGIIPKSGDTSKVKWIKSEKPFFVYHFVNAYEKGNNIIVDFVRREELFTSSQVTKSDKGELYRTQINIKNQKLKFKKLLNYDLEFPVINEDFSSKHHRYTYLVSGLDKHNANKYLIRYDFKSNKHSKYDFGSKVYVGEPVFIPKKTNKNEDDGYLGLYVYDKVKNSSNFMIFDAKNISKGAITVIQMPQRIPYGLHGSWVDNEK